MASTISHHPEERSRACRGIASRRAHGIDPATLTDAACAILTARDPVAKVALAQRAAAHWLSGALEILGDTRPPDRPALRPPREMKRRRGARSAANRLALLHA